MFRKSEFMSKAELHQSEQADHSSHLSVTHNRSSITWPFVNTDIMGIFILVVLVCLLTRFCIRIKLFLGFIFNKHLSISLHIYLFCNDIMGSTTAIHFQYLSELKNLGYYSAKPSWNRKHNKRPITAHRSVPESDISKVFDDSSIKLSLFV